MKMLLVFIVLLASSAQLSFAGSAKPFASVYDFAAPIILNYNSLSADVPAGTIVYDNQNGRFFGLSSSDTWLPMSYQSGFPGSLNVVGSGGQQTIENAQLALSATPVVNSSSSGWVSASSITHNGTGDYTIGMSADFSTAPVCTCQPVAGATDPNMYTCLVATGASATAVEVVIKNVATNTTTDLTVNLICMGAYL